MFVRAKCVFPIFIIHVFHESVCQVVMVIYAVPAFLLRSQLNPGRDAAAGTERIMTNMTNLADAVKLPTWLFKPKSVIRPHECTYFQLFAALHALAAHLSLVFYLT